VWPGGRSNALLPVGGRPSGYWTSMAQGYVRYSGQGRPPENVAQHQAHVHAAVRRLRAVGEHRPRDEPLTTRERQPEQQTRDGDRRGLPAHGEQMQADREEQLPALRIAEVEVMQHLVRQLAPRSVHHFHPRAMDRRVQRYEHLAQRQPDHRLAAAARRGHVHRGQLDHELVRPGVHEHRRVGQPIDIGAGAPPE